MVITQYNLVLSTGHLCLLIVTDLHSTTAHVRTTIARGDSSNIEL